MNLRVLRTTAMAVALGMLLTVVGSVATASAAQATQTDTQGGITVKAVYVTTAYLKTAPRDPLAGKVEPERNFVIAITLDTHSGDLSTYDFLKNVTLRNDRGQQVTPTRWVSTAEGAHHRSGGLLFPKTDQAGRALEPQARTLELLVRALGGTPERVLRWSLPIE